MLKISYICERFGPQVVQLKLHSNFLWYCLH